MNKEDYYYYYHYYIYINTLKYNEGCIMLCIVCDFNKFDNCCSSGLYRKKKGQK